MDALQNFSVGDLDYVSRLDANNATIAAAIAALETGKVDATKLGAASGVATLGADGKVPASELPDLTSLYQLLSQKNAPGGYAGLDSAGKLSAAVLPQVLLDSFIVDYSATYQALSAKGQANGYAALDASGLVPTAQLPALPAPYDVLAFYPGSPVGTALLTKLVIPRAVTFPVGLAGSRGHVGANPAAGVTLSIKQNGTQIGTVTISTAGAFSFSFAAAVTMAAGDVLTVYNQAVADGSLADVSLTLVGTR